MYLPQYNAIKTLIESTLNTVKTVIWWNDQTSASETKKAVSKMAVYIQFPDEIEWRSMADAQQYADIDIIIHIDERGIADTPDSVLEAASTLYQEMHGHVLTDGTYQLSTGLMRTGSSLPQQGKVKKATITFSTQIYDWSACKTPTSVQLDGLDVTT